MIDVREEGIVHELRFDRPPVNALNPALVAALSNAIEAAPDVDRHLVRRQHEARRNARSRDASELETRQVDQDQAPSRVRTRARSASDVHSARPSRSKARRSSLETWTTGHRSMSFTRA